MNAHPPHPLRLAAIAERLLRQLDPAHRPEADNDGGEPADLSAIEQSIAAIATDARGIDRALLDLRHPFALETADLLACALAWRVETDTFFAHQIARFQEPLGHSRLLVGFLASAFGLGDQGLLQLAGGAAIDAGLLRLGNEDRPLCERSLAMPRAIASALAGIDHVTAGASRVDVPETRFGEAQLRDQATLAEWVAAEQRRVVHIASADRDEALAFACQIARQSGHVPYLVDGEAPPAPAWLRLRRAMPIMLCQLGVGESWTLPASLPETSPCCIVTGLDGRIASARPVRSWRATPLPCDEREAVWREWGMAGREAASLAARYRQGAGAIARGAKVMAAGGDSAEALAQTNPTLDLLAHRCPARSVPDDAIVAPPELLQALHQLEQRILLRERLASGLGPAVTARYRPGVRALFTGESGTGKTLAASWLSDRLGLPLYRVDMAALSSKWIGETEKNLSQLLDSAETSDAILFFDEADALFGARTEIGDSNDRHANAQTNFLLQRIEEFDGIALLTTNSRDRFDSAFVRRLDTILEFPLPDAAARRRLWQAHLGTGHSLDTQMIDTLARELDFAGGHIRNVVLGAAALALANGRSIEAADIDQALIDECRKLGQSLPGFCLA